MSSSRAATLLNAPGARDLVAALGGLALVGAFAPFAWWPAALLAPALLYWSCTEGTPGRAAWRGALYGFASFGAGVSWIHHSFAFANIGLALAIPLTVLFVAFLALFPALACVLFARSIPAVGRARALSACGFAAAYVFSEWLRGWFLTGFTWLQLGYAQVDGPLHHLLPLLGVYGVGLISALAGVGIVVAIQRSIASALTAITLLLAVFVAGTWLPAIAWTRTLDEPFEVAIVQGNIAQDQKWRPEMRQLTLERYRTLTQRHATADLVVWPETAVPGLRHRMQSFLASVREDALAAGNSVLLGLLEVDPSGRNIFNSVELLGGGEGTYRKRHLVPFGEYLPLGALLGPITRALNIPVSNFTPGAARQPPLNIGRHTLAAYVCYEIAFGGEVARTLGDAHLIITISNDAWFGDSLGPLQHLQMARARAIETGRYLVRATNTGVSVVVGPHGRVLLRLPQFEVADGAHTVRLMQGTTAYVRTGDAPSLMLMLVLGLLSVLSARRVG